VDFPHTLPRSRRLMYARSECDGVALHCSNFLDWSHGAPHESNNAMRAIQYASPGTSPRPKL